MLNHTNRLLLLLSAMLTVAGAQCAVQPEPVEPTVSKAIETAQTASPQKGQRQQPAWTPASATSQRTAASQQPDAPIATVNERPIARNRLIDLLLEEHGPGLLEQFIVLEAAKALAADRGIIVTSADVSREYDRALEHLAGPLEAAAGMDRPTVEQALDSILAQRNISHREFMLGMERTAFLRKLAAAEVRVSADEIGAEFERQFGPRVELRLIQLASSAATVRAQSELRTGVSFDEVARSHSVNSASAARGGLLEPFTAQDDAVPLALREAAFSMEVGEVSGAIRVGQWTCILKLERRLPAQYPDLDSVREQLESDIRERLAGSVMQDLHERLLRQARVIIHDPILREAFRAKHPDRP